MRLVAVNHVGVAELVKQAECERIGPLASHEPGIPDDANSKIVQMFFAVPASESHEPRGHDSRHVPREFQYVALGATDDSIVPLEQCRNNVDNVHIHRVHASSGPRTSCFSKKTGLFARATTLPRRSREQ